MKILIFVIKIYKKHLDYCYNLKETMSGEEIKSVRRKIMKILNITIFI